MYAFSPVIDLFTIILTADDRFLETAFNSVVYLNRKYISVEKSDNCIFKQNIFASKVCHEQSGEVESPRRRRADKPQLRLEEF